MPKPQTLTSGVNITLDGEEYVLVPTLKAATSVSNAFGGFAGAFQSAAAGDLAAFQRIIRAGIPLKQISSDDLNEAVWKTGLPKLAQPVARFIAFLQNGGRDPDLVEEEAEDADEAGEGNG